MRLYNGAIIFFKLFCLIMIIRCYVMKSREVVEVNSILLLSGYIFTINFLLNL